MCRYEAFSINQSSKLHDDFISCISSRTQPSCDFGTKKLRNELIWQAAWKHGILLQVVTQFHAFMLLVRRFSDFLRK